MTQTNRATAQPTWRRMANLGDVSPLDYGGYFVFRDLTKQYAPEAEWLEEPLDDESPLAMYTIYRFSLDRLQVMTDDETHNVYLVPERYARDWPHALSQYDVWFHKHLASVAETMGSTYEELRAQFCSADPLERAHAYREIGQYHGFANLDAYPIQLTRAQVRRRYRV